MITLYDSGLGGLSVLREVRTLLPEHDLTYLADTAYCPYGPRPVEFVRARALAVGRWAAEQGARMLVVACNTASSAALELLRAELPLPVVGMEPGLKPAVSTTRSGVVGVLATSNTLAGERFAALVERFADGATVVTQPCPGLVEQVERGDLSGPQTRALVTRYVEPLLAHGADTLVLGCTHYPFLRAAISEVAGSTVAIIDTGPAVARQVERVAIRLGLRPGTGALRCYTTADPALVAPPLLRLLGEPAPVEHAAI
ncbi:MAG TPA: glutamate racemase [Roseiflexaceae bacterium]|nr:glutamate racemase [Roseiflexaceae bacterium]